jgi:hypothetical protein
VTLSFHILHGDIEADNEETIRAAICRRLEALANQYDGDEAVSILLLNGLDRAVMRKLNVRPMVYVENAVARPQLVLELGGDLRSGPQPIPETTLISIEPQIENLSNHIEAQIVANRLQTV